MIYKHRYFQFDTESKRIFDENRKELRLTGNALRVLNFLCEKKSANITEIGAFLDWAKDYDENHMRQYRYKVNSIIGHDVIEYKNGIYFLIGEVQEAEKIESSERNTDLLRADTVKSGKSVMDKTGGIKFNAILALVAIVLLLLSFFDWSYGYYNLLRIIVTGVAIYYAYCLYSVIKKISFWFWSLIAVAIIFNPIFPIYLGNKTTWGIIDVIVVLFFIVLIIRFKNYGRKNQVDNK